MATREKILFINVLLLFITTVACDPLYSITYESSKSDCRDRPERLIYQQHTKCNDSACIANNYNISRPYKAFECNVTRSRFESALQEKGSGRYFIIDRYYGSSDRCKNDTPYYIEALVTDSCKGFEDYSCQNADIHSRKCVYFAPTGPVGNVPSEIQPSNPQPTQSTENNPLTTLEKVIFGISLGGWAFGALFLVLWIRLRGYAIHHQAYFQLNQQEVPQSPTVITSKTDQTTGFDPKTKAEMLNIAPAEMIIDFSKKLGSGQASHVYAGIWRQKPVAIKIPQDRTAQKKLIAELTVLREIDQHPNIVEIHGYFYYENKLCVVLELCDSQNLETKVTREELSLADKFSIATGIAAGVAHLHNTSPGRPIVHRDLKPGNILLTKAGMQMIPKIADFDYSRLLASKSAVTFTTPTILYAAPECVGKERKEFSVKSDAWAYGATLFFLLTKKQPFATQTGLTLKRQTNEAKISFELLDQLPKDPFTQMLVNMTINCLENDPEDRPDFNQICTRFQEFFNGFVPWNNTKSNANSRNNIN